MWVPLKPTVLNGATIGGAKKHEFSVPPAEKGEVGLKASETPSALPPEATLSARVRA